MNNAQRLADLLIDRDGNEDRDLLTADILISNDQPLPLDLQVSLLGRGVDISNL